MLGYFVDLGMKTRTLPMTRISLTPASVEFPVDTEYPDYPAIQAYINQVLYPPVPTETPAAG